MATPSIPRHNDACDCHTCRQLKARVLDESFWRLEHNPHLPTGTKFEIKPFEHPEGDWFWLVCPCGAAYLTRSGDE